MEEVEVTIVGEAKAPIQILYRTHSDPLPEPVYTGNFGENGPPHCLDSSRLLRYLKSWL
jgi:hypothetical protein